MFANDSASATSQWSMEFMTNNDPQFSSQNLFDFNLLFPDSHTLSADGSNGYNLNSEQSFLPEHASETNNLESESHETVFSQDNSNTEVIKLKPGRKRKGEDIDRVALRRDRAIRNRLSAQRSRERKKKESVVTEAEREILKDENSLLKEKVQTLEATNRLLLSKLDLLSNQMLNIQSQLQVSSNQAPRQVDVPCQVPNQTQNQFNPTSSMLMGGFGETAELTVGVPNRSLSQQRIPLHLIQDWRVQIGFTLEVVRLFLLNFWLIHRLISISLFCPGTPNFQYLISFLKSSNLLPAFSSSSFDSLYYSPRFSTKAADLLPCTYFKWFPPRSD